MPHHSELQNIDDMYHLVNKLGESHAPVARQPGTHRESLAVDPVLDDCEAKDPEGPLPQPQ